MSKKLILALEGIFGLSILLATVFVYSIFAPRPVDRDLFAYIHQPYAKQDVMYYYSTGEEFGLAFVRLAPDQAKQVLARGADIFPDCQQESADNSKCTKTWVPNSVRQTHLITGNNLDKESLKIAQTSYDKTITKDSFCTFSPNILTVADTTAKHRLCINPINGYVMYIYLNP